VLVESVNSTTEASDRGDSWTTVGVHQNVVEASWLALVDALAFAAMRNRARAQFTR
jgi:2-isopropylmalate synthase